MTKTTISATVNSSTLEDFKRIIGKGNLSSEIEKFMRNSVGQSPEQFDKAILDKKIENLNNKILPLITERNKLNEELELIDQKQKEQELEKLEADKEIQEKVKSCFGCGKVITENDKTVIREDNIYCNFLCFEKLSQEKAREKE